MDTDRPTRGQAEEAVRVILSYLGEDPDRAGLQDTPKRVIKAWKEFTMGSHWDPRGMLQTSFDLDDVEGAGKYGQIILSKGIPFVSNCEHHMLPFTGVVHVAYVPNDSGKVVGLSKLARVADAFARRFQVQERLTQQIADCIQEVLDPAGVAVVVEGQHSCQCNRGIRLAGSMVTIATHGTLAPGTVQHGLFWKMLKS